MASTSGVRCVDEVYECLDGTLVDIENNSCDSINNEHSSTLKNIPLQKMVQCNLWIWRQSCRYLYEW